MADDLDSFFKKKDGKKPKGKKFTVSDPLSSTQSDIGKSGKRDKPKTQQLFVSGIIKTDDDVFLQQVDDAEWIEIKEEKKDYSGLRIQNLMIKEQQSQDSKSDLQDEYEVNEKGESVLKKPAGPWKPVPEKIVPAAAEEKPKVEEVKPAPVPVVKPPSRYVPPSLRIQQGLIRGQSAKKESGTPKDPYPTLISTVGNASRR